MTSPQTAELPRPELSPAQRALFEARLGGLYRPPTLARRAGGGDAPLTFDQERFWFLDRLGQGAAYNISMGMRVEGGADEAALQWALGEVVRRHEVLRTTFHEADGVPAQRVAPFAGFALPVHDLSALGEAEREGELRRAHADLARHPFDLTAGPLFRALLLRLGAEEHALVFCMHHIVSDGWSLRTIIREMWALYDAFCEGRPSPLPELPVQYADWAVWERGRPQRDAETRHLAYWRDELDGIAELLELPADRPRPPVPTFRGGRVPVHVPGGVLERLRALARSEGATLYMVVLAAFDVLLSRYSGSDDVVVGTPVAGRTRKEVEDLVGLFINTLVLRARLGGDPTFREMVGRIRETVLAAYEHQDVPFERVVAELRPERSLSRSPLFQVMFQLNNAVEVPVGGEGRLRTVQLAPEQDTMRLDLTLGLDAYAHDIRGDLFYSADLFERGTVERMAEHLERLLERVAADPDRPLSRLELIGGAERARVVEEWNRTAAFPVSGALHRRFEAQAARAPRAAALSCEGRALSYEALNARANRLARRLQALGVGPESRVGLCAERSPELIVGILAILKAGGAYVPLDPAYPSERLAYMARDSGVRVLLAQEALRGRVPDDGVRLVLLDEDPAGERADDLGLDAHPEQLAYVIYTSGSTGRPKGVGVTHGNVLRLFDCTQASFGFGAEDVWTLFHAYAFDFSVWEIWGALLHGGRLVVVPWVVSRDPAAFRALLAREGVSVLNQTPSAFRALAQADEAAGGRLEALRAVVFGGEALQLESLRGWLGRYGPERPRLVNMYGITETTVHVTWHTVTGAELGREQMGSPIGVPIPDLRAYVLDPAGSPAPIGVPGELHVGGAGVARGYLGRPALTAQRFVPDPFPGEGGARLYRSGDRARWKADGTLEYLGRMDQQVKVRGFRIELGEIETVLLAQPGVTGAAVVVRGEGDEAALVAYAAVSPDAPSPTALRAALQRHLPEYMVPTAVVAIDRIPLTANGKLDRRALPAPRYAGDALAEAPASYLEVQLIQLWEEELGVEGIGPTQSFFDLGGNSILALRLFARVNRVLRCDLPVATLFTGATVREMARAIEEQRSASGPVSPVVPLQPEGPLPPIFFIHSADRNVMGYVNLVRHLGAGQPAYGLRDLGDMARPIERIAAEHVESMRSVQPHGPYYLIGWCFGGQVASVMALQLEREGEAVAFLGLLDSMSPDIAQRWPVETDGDLAVSLAGDMAWLAQRPFTMDAGPLAGLGYDEILRRVIAEMRAQGAAPPEFDEEVLDEHCRSIRDRHASIAGYETGRLSTPVTLFRATEDREPWVKFFESCTDEEKDTMGWCRHAAAPVTVFAVPGNHVTLGSEPNVRVLVGHMRERLAAARARFGSAAPAAAPQP
jgi:amino acid adenylation domain-containing protein